MNNIKNLERIERFVNKEMDAQEQFEFETELKFNAELQEDLNQYNNLVKGINLYTWKQKAQNSYKQYKQFKLLKALGITAVVLAIGAASYLTLDAQPDQVEIESPSSVEQTNKDWKIPKESFTIDAEKEIVLESKNGTVIAIPEEAFLDEENNTIKGDITFELTEAFDPLDIMKAGLSTKSNNDLLESAGMFLVEAYQNGKALILNPDKPILFEVPTVDKKEGMMLFDGEKSEDGSINWVNPKELDNYLTTVDIHTLNFYPTLTEGPGFEEKLLQLGYQNPSKRVKDSIFYSFYCKGSEKPQMIEEYAATNDDIFESDSSSSPIISWDFKYDIDQAIVGKNFNIDFNAVIQKKWYTYGTEFLENVYPTEIQFQTKTGSNGKFSFKSIGAKQVEDQYLGSYTKFENNAKYILTVPITDEIVEIKGTLLYGLCNISGTCQPAEQSFHFSFKAKNNSHYDAVFEGKSSCGIEPSQIKAIWNDKFQNTLLATKEFEQRLQVIYHTCNSKVLDLYLNNMDKNLYEIDLKAAKMSTDWKKNAFENFAKEKKGKVKMNRPTLKSLNAYYQKKSRTNHLAAKKAYNVFWKKQNQLDKEAQNKKVKKSQKDYKRQSENFQKELNLNLKSVYKQLGVKRFQFHINTLGPKNIDQYVFEATRDRESTTIKYKGKTAKLTYEPIEVTIENESDYDFVNVYLTTNELTSYMKVKKENNVYKEKLNDLIEYNLVAIAYKGKQGYVAAQKPVTGNEKVTFNLKAKSDQELKKIINRHSKRIELNDIKEDVIHSRFLIRDNVRVQKNKNLRNLERELRPIIFPCWVLENDGFGSEETEEEVAE